MARTTPAQKPRGCARYTSIGLPLRKLHHVHFLKPPCGQTLAGKELQYPHHTVPAPDPRFQAHGSTGLCVKKTGPGKGGSRNDRVWNRRLRYYSRDKLTATSLDRHFFACRGGLYQRAEGQLGLLAAAFEVSPESNQNKH